MTHDPREHTGAPAYLVTAERGEAQTADIGAGCLRCVADIGAGCLRCVAAIVRELTLLEGVRSIRRARGRRRAARDHRPGGPAP